MDMLYKRRSIRKFKPGTVSPEILKDLVRAGMAAPSAGNQQPWEFVLMTDPTPFEEIVEVHPNGLPLINAGAGIMVCGELSRCKYPDYWVQDCSAATENILLAAVEAGLGACWLGIHPRLERVECLKRLYKLPEMVVPLCIIAVGIPDEEKPSVDRYNEQWIHENTW